MPLKFLVFITFAVAARSSHGNSFLAHPVSTFPAFMQTSTCFNCRLVTHSRFRQRLVALQNGRRKLSSLSVPEVAGSWYWDTKAPTKENLAAAAHFFKNHKPARLWTGELWKSSELWRRSKSSSAQKVLVPEVVFLGRSNVGKSTLINALAGVDLNRVSATPGMTEVMAAWGMAAKEPAGGAIKGWDGDMTPKITLVDMPGYGFGSRQEWGNQIVSYLNKRRNLRRAFLLVDSVHGIMAADRHMLEIFQKLGIPFQLIATKCDRLRPGVSESDIREALEKMKGQTNNDKSALMLGEIIAVGSLKNGMGVKTKEDSFGIRNLQWAILKAANLEWLAMDKAAVHKVIDKSATQRPEAKIDAEISHLMQRKTDDAEPATEAEAAPSSSSSSLPNLSLQEFMREILGTGSGAGISPSSELSRSRDQPRVFDPLATNDPKRWKTSASIHEQLDNAYKEVQQHMHPLPEARRAETMSQQNRATSPSASFSSLAPSRSPTQPPKTHTGLDAIEAILAELPRSPQTRRPQTPPQTSRQPQRVLSRTGTSPIESQARRQPQRVQTKTSPAVPQQAAIEGKGVSRGFDAFESMFAEPPKQSKSQSKSSGGGRRRGKRGGGGGGSSSKASLEAPVSRNAPPAIVGKGVSRGMDAFESMFSEPAKKARRR